MSRTTHLNQEKNNVHHFPKKAKVKNQFDGDLSLENELDLLMNQLQPSEMAKSIPESQNVESIDQSFWTQMNAEIESEIHKNEAELITELIDLKLKKLEETINKIHFYSKEIIDFSPLFQAKH